MMTRVLHWSVSVATALLVVAGAAGVARAGHYDLVDVEELVPAADRARLARVGITTTKALVEQLAAKKARKKAARRSGISYARLTAWTSFCDLLRIDGVGPTMARLMQAGGVPHLAAMGRQDPDDLLVRVTAANLAHQITALLPGREHLVGWIGQAQKLPVIFEE